MNSIARISSLVALVIAVLFAIKYYILSADTNPIADRKAYIIWLIVYTAISTLGIITFALSAQGA